MKNNNYSLELKNIDKIYDNGFQAIFNTNLKIHDREFIVLVGPSGCGKTTTLRIIAGLEKASSGNIWMKNEDVTELDARFRNISMVFQSYALFPHLSVKDNIGFTLKVKRKPKDEIERKISWAAKELGLEHYLSRKPKNLSGGQRQRVALGRAIVAEPNLFLLDEPLSNLDAKLRTAMRTTIKGLHNRLNVTTIYVTHDQVEAMTMADRIVVMRDGFVQQIDTPQRVFDNPANIFVAGFIGTPGMNFLEGHMSSNNFIFGQTKIKLPKFKLKNIKEGQKISLGIRPQHISIDKNVRDTYNITISGKVVFVELLGNEKIIIVKDINKKEIRAVLNNYCEVEVGEDINLYLNANRIHLFDMETTLSLTSSINEETMHALESWMNSSNEIKVRQLIMKKEQAKNLKHSILSNIIILAKEKVNPKEFIYDSLLRNLASKKIKIKKELKEQTRKIKITYYKLKEEIKDLDNSLKNDNITIQKIKKEKKNKQNELFNAKKEWSKIKSLKNNCVIETKKINKTIASRKKIIRQDIKNKKMQRANEKGEMDLLESKNLKKLIHDIKNKRIVFNKHDAKQQISQLSSNNNKLKLELLKLSKIKQQHQKIDILKKMKYNSSKIWSLRKQILKEVFHIKKKY